MEIVVPKWLYSDDIPLLVSDRGGSLPLMDFREVSFENEERAIMADLFSCLTGGYGSYIKRNEDKKYSVNAIIRDSIHDFVENLIPLCNNCLKIKCYSERHYEFKYGRMKHVFCYSLRNYLLEYYKTITILESSKGMSLALLFSNLRKEIETFNILSLLCDKVDESHGATICDIIYQLHSANRGIDHVKKTLSTIFENCIGPVLRYIEKWVYLGEIDDPHGEFFIIDNKGTIVENNIDWSYWEDRFSSIKEKVPGFIPKGIAELIVSIGKVSSVMKECNKSIVSKVVPMNLESVQRTNELISVYEKSSKVLINVLNDEHKLYECFDTIWDVLLCHKSDWLTDFMRFSSSRMKKSREEVSAQDFEELLPLILKPMYLKFLNVKIKKSQLSYSIERIHAVTAEVAQPKLKKTKVTGSRSLWENFALQPKIEWPLNIIINPESQRKYTLLFRHVLLWKRLDKKYCSLWRYKNALRQISASRYAIHVFITEFLNFMSATVIHPSWTSFLESLEKAESIESIISSHNLVLQHLMKGFFLLNIKIFKWMSHIATIAWHFAKEMKKWSRSTSNNVTTNNEKMQLAIPLLNYFSKFQHSVGELLKDLSSTAENEGSSFFVDFALSITVNNFFGTIK